MYGDPVFRKYGLFILGIFAATILVRIAYFNLVSNISTTLIGDEESYFEIVNNFIAGNGWQVGGKYALRPPFVPFTIYLFKTFVTDNIVVMRYIYIFINSFIPVVYFFCFLKLKFVSGKMAKICAVILAIYPPLIFYSQFLLTESMGCLLIGLSLLYFFRAAEEKKFYSNILSALFFLMLVACRPQYFFIPLIMFCIEFYNYYRKKITSREIIGRAVLIIIFLSGIFCWGMRNYYVIGKFIPLTTLSGTMITSCNCYPNHPEVKKGGYFHDDFIRGQVASAPEKDYMKISLKILKSRLHGRYSQLIPAIINRALKFFSPRPNPYKTTYDYGDYLMYIIWLPIMALYLLSFRYLTIRKDLYFNLFVIYALLMVLPFWGAPRFRLPVEAFILFRALYAFLYLTGKNIGEKCPKT